VYKYWKLFLAAFQKQLEYRADLYWQLISSLMRVGIIYILWVNILGNGFGTNSYNQNSLAVYYLTITFISFFNDFNFGEIADDIREGGLSNHLLMPYNYFLRKFLGSIPMMIISVGVFIISIILLRFLGVSFTINVSNLLWGIPLLGIVSITNFALSVSIGSLAFWFRRVHGFNFLFFSIGSLFSGELIPVDLLPKNFADIGNYLPFKYLYYFPAKFLTQSFDLDTYVKTFSIAILWAATISIIACVIWKKGLSKFEATGR
jgi:ABC-2 type transport system permease protein